MKKKIAFICVHNSCRSQIAEALGIRFLSDKYDFYSAGTQTKQQINKVFYKFNHFNSPLFYGHYRKTA